MPLDDPVLIYRSANNMYAFLVQIYLAGEGIEAIALDPGTAKHREGQVWISRNDAANAIQKLTEYLERMHAKAEAIETRDDEPIDVICEECGQTSTFHGSYFGSVQECSHCSAYLDVDDSNDPFSSDYGEIGDEHE